MASEHPLRVTALAGTAQLGGAERVLLDFANRAFEFGVALKVLTPEDGPIIGILNKIGVPAEVLPAPEGLLDGFRRGSWFRPHSMLGMLRWSRGLKAHPFVRETDVVYTIAFRCHQAASLARLHPVVWHLHQFPPEGFGAYWRSLARRVPDGLIANSAVVKEAWEGEEKGEEKGEEGGGRWEWRRWRAEPDPETRVPRPPLRVTVIHNGVNLDRFKPRERTFWIHDAFGIPHDHRLIGMPALFARWKGHFEVLEAFDRVRQRVRDAHLVIVGGSTYQTEAEEKYGEELKQATGEFRVVTGVGDQGSGTRDQVSGVRDQGSGSVEHDRPSSPPNVHMLPFQREVELAYPEFDVAVHYSVRPEPFGRVILEAMACGVPIVAAAEGGPVEVLGVGSGDRREPGWLAEPRSPAELARILEMALTVPAEELRTMGAAGRRRAEDHFSSRRFAAEVGEVLRGVKSEE